MTIEHRDTAQLLGPSSPGNLVDVGSQEASLRALRERVFAVLALARGVRNIACVCPVRLGERTALVNFWGSGVTAVDLQPLAVWADEPDTWLVDRLLCQAARCPGPTLVSSCLPRAARVALERCDLADAIACPVMRRDPAGGRVLVAWLLVGTDGHSSRWSERFAQVMPLVKLIASFQHLGGQPSAASMLILYDRVGQILQCSHSVQGRRDLHEVGRMLAASGIREEGPVVSPYAAAVRAARLGALLDQNLRWIVRVDSTLFAPIEPHHSLTARQREVADLAAHGARNHEIASYLGIASATVKVHLRSAYDTLGVGNRAEIGAHASVLSRRISPVKA